MMRFESNIMCVDLEDWFHANLADLPPDIVPETRIERNTLHLLALFQQYNIHATFFVVGEIAEKYPKLIKTIHDKGHEIGCHSNAHKLVYTMTPEEFRQDTLQAKERLEALIDEPVVSYRAPSWSITEKSFWALQVLQELGIKVDSSIFPFKNFLYGVKNAPRFKYNTERYQKGTSLTEYPPSTIRICGQNIPFSGGFYLRLLPVWFVKWCIKSLNHRQKAAVIYIHPWEIDADTPRLELNLRDRIIQYIGIRGNEKKLIQLLKTFSFSTMKSQVGWC